MITASIVLYNNSKDELHTVVRCATDSIAAFVYVVDNSPSDDLRKFVEGLSRKVIYIWTPQNVGYGAAHNMAIQKSIEQGATYHLVMNADIDFKKDVIEELATFMDHHPAVGLVMPKILYPDGHIQYLCKLFPTPTDLIFRRFFSFTSRAKKKQEKYELRMMDYTQVHFGVPSLSGCFMLLRTTALAQITGFDERYFLYLEDVDLCRRLHRVSQTAFYPEASIVHHYAKGSYKQYRLLHYHICAAVKYFNKWGWFFDRERGKINKKILQQLNYNPKP
ncbi:MAG: glycosyltransferase family 2 protein [Prevotellaceae bacterium]|jgi:GT2 family glycosyltransferase|nr:glycosyltransferase family 2 protein [Prevotellaceae bacterium]